MTYRERWARLRGYLWQPPRPHGEQPRDRVVGPLELFYAVFAALMLAAAPEQAAALAVTDALIE